MLFPEQLEKDEYIRLIAMKKNNQGSPICMNVEYVQSYEEYAAFVHSHKLWDVYNQIATNKGKENGKEESQYRRKVLYFDFDKKDYSDLTDAADFSKLIKEKLPKLFLHACINSGHGYHFYVSVILTDKVQQLLMLNKELIEIVGADPKAALPTQIARIPGTYNHKLSDGSYNYTDLSDCGFVKVVFNDYGKGERFTSFSLDYIEKIIKNFLDLKALQEHFELRDVVRWDYESLTERPCYLCIQKVFHEGAIKGQRNFWHGRIVHYFTKKSYQESTIYSLCQEWNARCDPPKSQEEIEADTKRFLEKRYNFGGCFQSFPEGDIRREWVGWQCDQACCGTYQNGSMLSPEEDKVRLSMKILLNSDLRIISGHDYLIISILDFYGSDCGRKGFRVSDLKERLTSAEKQKKCMSDEAIKASLLRLQSKKWIEITPDRKNPKKFNESKLKLSRRLREMKNGYIEFYRSILDLLVDGKIPPKAFLVYITLIRNLENGKNVSYDQLADDLDMNRRNNNIFSYIKLLEKEKYLLIEKEDTGKGFECNRYRLISPGFVDE